MRLSEAVYAKGFPVKFPDGSIHFLDLSREAAAFNKLDPASKARAFQTLFSQRQVTPLTQSESSQESLRIIERRHKRRKKKSDGNVNLQLHRR